VLTLPAQILGIFSSLAAAASWGGGDFAGGIATRRNHAFLVLAITGSTGMILLTALAIITGETQLTWRDGAWAVSAGIFGGVGLISLFQGLALGSAAVVSSISGVVGVVVPVIAGAFLEGLPSPWQFAGFLLGIAGIWMVTRSGPVSEAAVSQTHPERSGGPFSRPVVLAFTAGVSFGLFFVLIAQVSPEAVFAPLAISKATQAAGGLALVLFLRIRMSDRAGIPAALLSGLLDVGGNTFFLLASKLTRLDAASVLVSMYPVGTVLLSRMVLKERVSPYQWLGVALCVGAIALIAI
jgi:drug/metabolite transporter (DMT)-like permease